MEHLLKKSEQLFKRKFTRKGFVKIFLGSLTFLIANEYLLKWVFAKEEASPGRAKNNIRGLKDLVVAEGQDPYLNTVRAVEAMGGMGHFVKNGAVVVIKPNMAWDRTPAQAANTEPQVVAALIDLCYQAGAKRVNVFDVPCNDDRRVYANSGIEKTAREHKASVYFADHWNVVKAHFPYASPLEGWPVLRDAVVCDTFINVPVLKHHGLTRLTLSMKNLMGVCSGTRGMIHINIGRKLVDLTDFISPDLTVIDATRVLVRNGPSGGNLADVEAFNKVIVGTDPVLADAYACGLMQVQPAKIPYLQEAAHRNFGNLNVEGADIQVLKV